MPDFTWSLNEPPPTLEDHSKAKLDVLRRYLRAYLDTMCSRLGIQEFKLDLIDGFAGGGAFKYDNQIIPGSPVVMLEEVDNARTRLNQRRHKPLQLNCTFHFVDMSSEHISFLRQELSNRGYLVDQETTVLYARRFEEVAAEIIEKVRRRQPQAGRSIFLLDQTGYSKVNLSLVADILRQLPNSEVILTFASDVLFQHLYQTGPHTGLAKVGLSESEIHDLSSLNFAPKGAGVVQRLLLRQIRAVTGATYYTPFFIRPRQSRLALWFIHLSRHPKARDVMVNCHWESFNTFEHYGDGGLDMLGWDAIKSDTIPLFHFEDMDADRLHQQLFNQMPGRLHSLATDGPMSVSAFRHNLSNDTAARFTDMDTVLIQLHKEHEIEILNSDGRQRSNALSKLDPKDSISLPTMRFLPGFSRIFTPS